VSVAPLTPSEGGVAAARLGFVGVVGVSLGVLTAYAQEWLPPELGSIANSAGSWALVAFLLAMLLATGARGGAVIGSLALVALLVGYVLGANARGVSAGSSLIVFWGAAALLAGPLVGICGFWAKSGQTLRPAIGVGLMSGILIGEGIYGLTFIADTTYAPYWWVETATGILLAAWVLSRGPDRLQKAPVTAAVGALTAAAFLVVYSQDLIAVLP
jgi:Family of unknown function (DUF6518)